MTARDNFMQMLGIGEITALRPHCLHRRSVPEAHLAKFNVCCFTECPLTQIQHMIGYKPGRQVQLEPYGFVFRRELLIERGAQPVTNINSYDVDKSIRQAYDMDFEEAKRMKFTGTRWKKLAFLSAMHSGYDFSWEREWRHLADFSFEKSDLVCVVVPDGEDVEIREKLARLAVPMFCPEWGLEQLLEEFGRQQRRTKRLIAQPFAKKPTTPPPVKRVLPPKPLRKRLP